MRPTRSELSNGMVVLSMPNPANPFVAFRGSLPSGSARDPPGREGAAEMVSRLLMSGTKGRRAARISDRVESLGATLGFIASEEAIFFHGRCDRKAVRPIFELVVECLRDSTFPSAEVERVRGEVLTELRQVEDDTSERAHRPLAAALYPGHAYGRDTRGTAPTVEAIAEPDLIEFRDRDFGPRGAIVALSGDLDDAFVRRQVSPIFETWGDGGEPGSPPVPGDPRRTALAVPMPHKSQADVAVGLRAIPRRHGDYYALHVANLILGRLGLGGRIGFNVRDTQGLAYYAHSALDARLVAGDWSVTAGVNPRNLPRALAAIRREVERLRDDPFTEEEVETAKTNQIGTLSVGLERNAEMAAEVHRMEYYGLGTDFLERYPSIVRSLTPERVRGAAESYIRLGDLSVVVAGPVPPEPPSL